MIIKREIRTAFDGKVVVKINIYDSAKECLEAHWGCQSSEVREIVGYDVQGKQYRLTPEEILANITKKGCWGFCDKKGVLHIWLSGECDLSDLIELLGHERGHALMPHYKKLKKEEIKAGRYGETARLAYQTAIQLKELAKKDGEAPCFLPKTENRKPKTGS
jgi:hypothetical protein